RLDRVEPDAAWKRAEAGTPLVGDLFLTNGRLLAVARKRGTGLELYSCHSGRPIYRATLQAGSGTMEKIELSEIGRSAGAVTISWKDSSAKFRLANRDQFVEAQAFSGDAPLRIDCPGRFVVLPAFFADDLLDDACKLPLP